jgi:endonuclease/exonuclease/phosphatase family metal-dependent hydrolase
MVQHKFLLVFLPFLVFAQPEQHKALSYNIRFDGHTDLAPDWKERKIPIMAQLQAQAPTIIGFQEVLYSQLTDLKAALTSYRAIGVGRDDGQTAGEFSPIFYDTTRYICQQSGTFWLSSSPEKPSKGWDAALNRICTYALLESKFDHQLLWVFNTHFDHIGEEARLQSAQLLQKKYTELQQNKPAPILLMGDFNAEPDSFPIIFLRKSFKDLSCSMRHPELCSGPTFNAFSTSNTDDKIIDYFFGSASLMQIKYEVLRDTFERSYPSDHFPIVLNFISL